METTDSMGTRTWGLGDVETIRVLTVVGTMTGSSPCDKCHQDMVWGWRICLEKKDLPDDTIDVCMTCLGKLSEQFKKTKEEGADADGE